MAFHGNQVTGTGVYWSGSDEGIREDENAKAFHGTNDEWQYGGYEDNYRAEREDGGQHSRWRRGSGQPGRSLGPHLMPQPIYQPSAAEGSLGSRHDTPGIGGGMQRGSQNPAWQAAGQESGRGTKRNHSDRGWQDQADLMRGPKRVRGETGNYPKIGGSHSESGTEWHKQQNSSQQNWTDRQGSRMNQESMNRPSVGGKREEPKRNDSWKESQSKEMGFQLSSEDRRLGEIRSYRPEGRRSRDSSEDREIDSRWSEKKPLWSEDRILGSRSDRPDDRMWGDISSDRTGDRSENRRSDGMEDNRPRGRWAERSEDRRSDWSEDRRSPGRPWSHHRSEQPIFDEQDQSEVSIADDQFRDELYRRLRAELNSDADAEDQEQRISMHIHEMAKLSPLLFDRFMAKNASELEALTSFQARKRQQEGGRGAERIEGGVWSHPSLQGFVRSSGKHPSESFSRTGPIENTGVAAHEVSIEHLDRVIHALRAGKARYGQRSLHDVEIEHSLSPIRVLHQVTNFFDVEEEEEEHRQEYVDREKYDRERFEREQLSREHFMDREHLGMEHFERMRLNREYLERERFMNRERLNRERLRNTECSEREHLDREPLNREQLRREHLNRKRLEREHLGRERLDGENLVGECFIDKECLKDMEHLDRDKKRILVRRHLDRECLSARAVDPLFPVLSSSPLHIAPPVHAPLMVPPPHGFVAPSSDDMDLDPEEVQPVAEVNIPMVFQSYEEKQAKYEEFMAFVQEQQSGIEKQPRTAAGLEMVVNTEALIPQNEFLKKARENNWQPQTFDLPLGKEKGQKQKHEKGEPDDVKEKKQDTNRLDKQKEKQKDKAYRGKEEKRNKDRGDKEKQPEGQVDKPSEDQTSTSRKRRPTSPEPLTEPDRKKSHEELTATDVLKRVKQLAELQQELDQLVKEKEEWLSQQENMGSDGQAPILPHEMVSNTQRQLEIGLQMKALKEGQTVASVLDDVPHFPSDQKKQPDVGQVINCCKRCNSVFNMLPDFIDHLSSPAHLLSQKPSRHLWQKEAMKKYHTRDTATTGDKGRLGRGAELLVSTVALFCPLCSELCHDSKVAMAHLRSKQHLDKYQEYVTKHPSYERHYLQECWARKKLVARRIPSSGRGQEWKRKRNTSPDYVIDLTEEDAGVNGQQSSPATATSQSTSMSTADSFDVTADVSADGELQQDNPGPSTTMELADSARETTDRTTAQPSLTTPTPTFSALTTVPNTVSTTAALIAAAIDQSMSMPVLLSPSSTLGSVDNTITISSPFVVAESNPATSEGSSAKLMVISLSTTTPNLSTDQEPTQSTEGGTAPQNIAAASEAKQTQPVKASLPSPMPSSAPAGKVMPIPTTAPVQMPGNLAAKPPPVAGSIKLTSAVPSQGPKPTPPVQILSSVVSKQVPGVSVVPKGTLESADPTEKQNADSKGTPASFISKAIPPSPAHKATPTSSAVTSMSPAPKATPTSPAPKATPTCPTPKATPTNSAPKATPTSVTPKATPTNSAPKATPTSVTPKATPTSVTPKATPTIPAPKAAHLSTVPKEKQSSASKGSHTDVASIGTPTSVLSKPPSAGTDPQSSTGTSPKPSPITGSTVSLTPVTPNPVAVSEDRASMMASKTVSRSTASDAVPACDESKPALTVDSPVSTPLEPTHAAAFKPPSLEEASKSSPIAASKAITTSAAPKPTPANPSPRAIPTSPVSRATPTGPASRATPISPAPKPMPTNTAPKPMPTNTAPKPMPTSIAPKPTLTKAALKSMPANVAPKATSTSTASKAISTNVVSKALPLSTTKATSTGLAPKAMPLNTVSKDVPTSAAPKPMPKHASDATVTSGLPKTTSTNTASETKLANEVSKTTPHIVVNETTTTAAITAKEMPQKIKSDPVSSKPAVPTTKASSEEKAETGATLHKTRVNAKSLSPVKGSQTTQVSSLSDSDSKTADVQATVTRSTRKAAANIVLLASQKDATSTLPLASQKAAANTAQHASPKIAANTAQRPSRKASLVADPVPHPSQKAAAADASSVADTVPQSSQKAPAADAVPHASQKASPAADTVPQSPQKTSAADTVPRASRRASAADTVPLASQKIPPATDTAPCASQKSAPAADSALHASSKSSPAADSMSLASQETYPAINTTPCASPKASAADTVPHTSWKASPATSPVPNLSPNAALKADIQTRTSARLQQKAKGGGARGQQ